MISKLILTTLLLAGGASAVAQQSVYLSDRGDDQGDGTKEHPYYSLNKALEQYGAEGDRTDTLFVWVQPGNYYMERPLILDTPSSRPVIVQSAGREKPQFIGGMRIGPWEACGNGLYRAYVPEVERFGFSFEQLYVNGKRATLARTPNEYWYEVKGSTEYPFVQGERAAAYAMQQVRFDDKDWSTLKDNPDEDLSQLKFRFYHKWSFTQKRAEYVCLDSAAIYIQGDGMRPWNPVTRGSRYLMYDYKGALDAPGEWYLDRRQGYVYYIPQEGEDMASAVCIAPVLQHWLLIKGQAGAPVSNIQFKNLAFQYTAYLMPDKGEEAAQSAVNASAGVTLDFAQNVSFVDCDWMHTGGYALWFRQGCRHNTVERCYLSDLGAGGIKVGETIYRKDSLSATSHNVVDNSIITHAGQEMPSGAGVLLLHTSDNRITHNDISDLRYSGISVGWTWGYNANAVAPSPAVRNLIEYNHIHHIGWGELSDMGAIYTLGESPGTRITHNVVHDIWAYDYGGWGLYTDEGSTGIEITSNLAYRCKSGGFHQHYGKDNRVENNIFAYAYHYQLKYTRPESHRSFSFRHNIILYDRGEVLAGNGWQKGIVDMDRNLYWGPDTGKGFAGISFREWKKQREPHSLMADPLFVDPKKDDFRIADPRNIRKVGFKPWDYAQAGVYGSDEWKKRAELSGETLQAFDKAVKRWTAQ